MTEIIEFDTDRLHLRQWIEADKAPFAMLNADSRVMEYFPSVLDRSTSYAMVDRLHSQIIDRGWGWWAVELKEDKQFIGTVGLGIPIADLPFSPCVEVGWRLAFPYWGKGYASEAARGALEVGFEKLCLSEIVSFTAIKNQRSRAVMERLGMIRAKETFEHPNIEIGYPLREHCLYRLSRDDWKKSNIQPKLSTV
jgi:RimJ/RimL family protein N-acetyltransferase